MIKYNMRHLIRRVMFLHHHQYSIIATCYRPPATTISFYSPPPPYSSTSPEKKTEAEKGKEPPLAGGGGGVRSQKGHRPFIPLQHMHSFFYKSLVYKNVETEIWVKIKNNIRTLPSLNSQNHKKCIDQKLKKK